LGCSAIGRNMLKQSPSINYTQMSASSQAIFSVNNSKNIRKILLRGSITQGVPYTATMSDLLFSPSEL
jgi:hypothetical protein